MIAFATFIVKGFNVQIHCMGNLYIIKDVR